MKPVSSGPRPGLHCKGVKGGSWFTFFPWDGSVWKSQSTAIIKIWGYWFRGGVIVIICPWYNTFDIGLSCIFRCVAA